ncbi:MAG: enoyl-CoA hydratase/isomerase family protein [Moraxellaceae bacterium]
MANQETDHVLQQEENGLVILTLNRPQTLNTIDLAMGAALRDVFAQLALKKDLRAVLLTTQGKYFSAGGDVAEFSGTVKQDVPTRQAYFKQIIENIHAAIASITALHAPVVACVPGGTSGIGISLIAACDFVLASEKSAYNMAYMNLAATPDGGATWSLPRLMGMRQARELILLSERFHGEDALRLGLVNRLVTAESLQDEALALARRLAAGPTQSYARAKKLLAQSLQNSLPEQLAAEQESFLASCATPDFVEGVSAFLEKRPAQFKG